MLQFLKKYQIILFVFLSFAGFDSYVGCSYKGHGLQEQNRNCSVKPMNLTDAKKAITDYYDSGCFDKEIDQVIDKAIAYFNNLNLTEIKNPTVIFDIDDSVLSTYPHQQETEFGYIQDIFHNWVLKADAPMVHGIKRLYDFLLSHGFKIIFLTGRFASERGATIKNLRAHGFVGYEKLITRNCENRKEKASVYKPAQRAKLTQEGYDIVGSVGDQLSDHFGPHIGHAVKLPNYFYTIG
jgi:acid phosphatase